MPSMPCWIQRKVLLPVITKTGQQAGGQVEVVLSYCHHSLNDSSLCDMLPYFESKGVGVIGASPMAMGLLTNQVRQDMQACKHGWACDMQRMTVTVLPVQLVTLNTHTPWHGSNSHMINHAPKPPPHPTKCWRVCVSMHLCHGMVALAWCGKRLVALRMNGLQGPPAWHPAPAPLQQACANAAAHAAAQGVDISKLALEHSVRLPGISSTLVGMASAELVDTNIATTLQALGQQANENEAEESRVAAEVLGLLAPVQGVTWPSGKPLPC
ncbi:aldo_ket_red domain-containing protein [Haematococcus lacustris]|uniref:Aldo_ket_red domain-containing protein n=1 Tax=Haematococcus lacustris TaxID=44745 RepID=A0A6A0A0A9_HAELA|nr:aldo_ket_red domain-containing protein [Haematococcus lacustris]